MYISFDPSGKPPKSILARVVGAVLGVVALGAALMFSALFFVVLAVVALGLWGYFWWKTRELRRVMREGGREGARVETRTDGFEAPRRETPEEGDVIEGEAVRLDEERNRPE